MSAPVLEPAEAKAVAFLQDYGFLVRLIPRSSDLTPEFEAECCGEQYLFEVKARRDDEVINNLEANVVTTRSQHLDWSAGVFKNISKALRQMRSYDPRHLRMWVVWLGVEAPMANDAVEDQFRGTLLGIRTVIDLAALGTEKHCFYAQRGTFEHFTDLDAAVISSHSGYQMWVNEFARPQIVVGSQLGKLFAENGGLNVPTDLAQDGLAYKMATQKPERTEQDVQQHLRLVYGLKRPILLNMKSHRAFARLHNGA